MIPVKIDSISISTKRENSMESIVDWFDQHKQSLYTLGWSYLRNQQQIEELFYRSIKKIHKELPRLKSEISFETWVTSIFIHTCRELSDIKNLQASGVKETRQEIFNALDQLKEYEKEAIILIYVKGLSKEEAAHLLQVPVEKMKEHLFSGIQALRKVLGNGTTYNGCTEYHNDYINYLDKTMERQRKIDFEVHLYHCHDCQEDLATFQDVMLGLTKMIMDLDVPSGFMEKVKDRLAEQEKQRKQKNKKRARRSLVFAGVFALLMGIGFFTGAFTHFYYKWTVEDLELRAFLQHDLGERLNLEAESNGVKIKIKGAIADDVQTLVFYEIEDTKEENQYMMSYDDGFAVENRYEIMGSEAYPRYYLPDLDSDVNKEEKNLYQGKISLPPLKTENGTIKLKITKLQKLFHNSPGQNSFSTIGDIEPKTGEWNFEIPVTKQPSIEYALKGKTKVEGIPVRFDKLIIAPTVTVLQYGINTERLEKRIDGLNFDNLQVNNKKMKADIYGNSFFDSQRVINWNTLQAYFDPLYGERPNKVNVQFKSAYLTIEDPKTIELDASKKYPQTFEYAGSTISIDKVEVGQKTKVVISNHDIENREFESFYFNILAEGESEINSMDMNPEGVLIDRNGEKYDPRKYGQYQEIEQPRYFTTVQNIELQSNKPGEKVIPKKLEVYGYNTTKYLDHVVKVSLEKQIPSKKGD
jgi:DNA-directed RNA polymerase specialized sigma24 family protein